MDYIHFENIDSTNNYAKTISNKKEWTVIYADIQNGGRGRNGKSWVSSKGGAWFTIIIGDNQIKIDDYGKIPLLIGAAVRDYLSFKTSKNFTIKWPNDIYYEDKKCSGILIEKIENYFIAGIGININNKIGEKGTENGIVLKEICSIEYDVIEIIKGVAENIKYYFEKIKLGKWQEIYVEISGKDYLFGKDIIIFESLSEKKAVANGISYDGRLKIKNQKGMEEEILSGDISVKINK